MKQLLQQLRDGRTIVADVPVPAVRPGTALIRTAASLVSAGTERTLVEFAEKNLMDKARSRPDLVRQLMDKARREGLINTIEAAFNRLDQPMPLGYSSAGTVVAVGAGMEDLKVGERVACAGGGYAVHAEYALVPHNLLARLPDQVDFESAAFATLGAIALHGFRLAQPQLGETVAVIGLGLLGLLSVGIARAAGCHVFGVDLSPERVKLAENMGAVACLRPDAELTGKAFSQGKGFDVVLICADARSNDPVELAGLLGRDRGRVVAVGAVDLTIPRKVYYEKELSFHISRSYGPGRYDPNYEEKGQDYPIGYVRWTEGRNLAAFVDLLGGGKLDVRPLITHRIPVEQGPNAYEIITGKRKEPFLGVLMVYPPDINEAPARRVDLQPAGTAPTSDIVVGVLGAGNYATAVFLPAVKKAGGARLAGIASAAGLNARHAGERFGFEFATSSEAEVIENPQVNVLAVLTRHNSHPRQVVAGLQQGKHVFCEKPLAIDCAGLEAVFQALQTPGAPLLSAGFNRRFAPLAIKLKDFFAGRGEALAAHFRVNAGYIPPTHWVQDPQVGGGRIIGEGCHFVDFLAFLIGEPPISVHATALPDGGRYSQDNVQITLSFSDGSIGTLTYLANGDKSLAKERLEVFSGGKVAILDDFRSLETINDGRRKTETLRLGQDKGHRAGWEAFLNAVRKGSPPPIPYEHLWGVTQATFAAVESLQSGVTVPVKQIQAR